MHLAGAVGTKVVAHLRADQRARRPRRCRGADAPAPVVITTTCGAGPVCCGSVRSIIAACAASTPPTVSRRWCHDARRHDTPAVFLDRDGTLNDDVGYLHRLDDLELFPWTADALRLLKRAGYALVVVTNQSGIAPRADRPGVRRRAATTRCARRLQRGGARSRRAVLLPASSARRRSTELQRRLPLPQAAPGHDRRRGARPRHRSDAVVGDRRQVARRAARPGGRRAVDPGAHRLGRGTRRPQRPAGQQVDAICDNLIHAVSVILHDG